MTKTQCGVVFDLDGTLVDTLADIHAAVVALCRELGAPPPPLSGVRTMVGDGARRLVERVLASTGLEDDEARTAFAYSRFLEHYAREPCRKSRPYAGVVETLERLARDGHRLGVCTNKPQAIAQALLDGLAMRRFFASLVGGDRARRRKPHPAHIEQVLEEMGVVAAAAVMVGDSRNDVASARAAGLPCIVVGYGYTAEPAQALGADRVIAGFQQLPEVLEALRPSP